MLRLTHFLNSILAWSLWHVKTYLGDDATTMFISQDVHPDHRTAAALRHLTPAHLQPSETLCISGESSICGVEDELLTLDLLSFFTSTRILNIYFRVTVGQLHHVCLAYCERQRVDSSLEVFAGAFCLLQLFTRREFSLVCRLPF